MFHIIVTYREQGTQRRQQYNADKLPHALEVAQRELAKPATRNVELTMTIETWTKQEAPHGVVS